MATTDHSSTVMNSTSQDFNNSVSSSSEPPPQDTITTSLPYIIGGAGGGCFLLAVLLTICLCRKCRRRTSVDVEANQDKSNGIYDEIGKKKKKQKHQKNAKHEKRKLSDQENNNDSPEIELVAIDIAPDIITAHDNESIYETLDGRRAARSKANQMAASGQPAKSDSPVEVAGGKRPSSDGVDSTYDHLSRYNNQRPAPLHQDLALKRLTDPEVVTRRKLPSVPRAAHSEGENVQFRCVRDEMTNALEMAATRGELSADNLRSSLTELARQSVSGGKRIVCQLTMVGVVENGKPVPVQKRAAGNAYFILEPSRNSGEVADDTSKRGPAPRFRIKSEDDCWADAADAGRKASDYFILEPLEQQEDFADTFHSPTHGPDTQDDDSINGDFGDRRSLHGQCSVSSFRDSDGRGGSRRPPSFRNTRLHSCPDTCEEETEVSTELLPRRPGYRRSFSSPQSSVYKRTREEPSPPQRRLDTESFQRPGLGLLNNAELNTDCCDGAGRESQRSDIVNTPKRQPRNDYFILEPQADNEGGQFSIVGPSPGRSEFEVPSSQPRPYTEDPREKPRYQQRQQAPGQPPRLPQRNNYVGHARSRSETPMLKPSSHGCTYFQDDDEGPVVVSLKKYKSEKNNSGPRDNVNADDDHKEPFRPRIKSESRVIRERYNRM